MTHQLPHGWVRYDFDSLPRSAGLYALYEDGRLLYIGKSWNLRSRVWNHRHLRRNGPCPLRSYGEPCHCPPAKTEFQGVNPYRMWVKIRHPRRHENWHETEVRLIYRLQPPFNRAGVRKKTKLFRTGKVW
jgi:hypothetical protein